MFLYDPSNPESCRPKRKPSPKQLETLAANRLKAKIKCDYREWYREVGFIDKDRVNAVLWAREQLALNDWVILDTETTGLYGAEIVEIAIVDCAGKPLLDTLVKPSILSGDPVSKDRNWFALLSRRQLNRLDGESKYPGPGGIVTIWLKF